MPKTILLADDSSTIRKIVELTFTGTEIRVEAFGSGAAALQNWERIAPDLILADVVMPGPDGYEVCRQVRAAGRAIPVVLLSSTFEPFDADMAQECGADRHLLKPFESSTLANTVRELLESSSAVASEPQAPAEPCSATDDAAEATIDEQEIAPPEPEALADELDERLVDAVSKAVVRRLSEQVVREIAREVVPDLAERIIRERIRQLENEES